MSVFKEKCKVRNTANKERRTRKWDILFICYHKLPLSQGNVLTISFTKVEESNVKYPVICITGKGAEVFSVQCPFSVWYPQVCIMQPEVLWPIQIFFWSIGLYIQFTNISQWVKNMHLLLKYTVGTMQYCNANQCFWGTNDGFFCWLMNLRSALTCSNIIFILVGLEKPC